MAAYTAIGVGVSFVIFVTIRAFAGPAPSTMNKEYQEATNEYLKVCPFHILSICLNILVWMCLFEMEEWDIEDVLCG